MGKLLLLAILVCLSVAISATRKFTILDTSDIAFNSALAKANRAVEVSYQEGQEHLDLSGTCNGCTIDAKGCKCTKRACTDDTPRESFVCGLLGNQKNIGLIKKFDQESNSFVIWNSNFIKGDDKITNKLNFQWIRFRASSNSWGVEKTKGKEEYHLLDSFGHIKSFWHDVPLKDKGYGKFEYNFIVEIPQNTLAKLEVSKELKHNPITQDTKVDPITKQKVDRFYRLFPNFNYGMLPQTYESPKPHVEYGNLAGDSDPIDVLELSGEPLKVGSVNRVSVFGCFPLVDQGEIDWKLLAIRSDHPLAAQIKDIKDYAKLFPEKFDYLASWFLQYKILEGKPAKNYYLSDYMTISREKTNEVIEEMHHYWEVEIKANGYVYPPTNN